MKMVLGVLAALVFSTTAQARYLHIAKVQPAAANYVADMTDLAGGTDGKLGRCWHKGPHVVQCSYTMRGVQVCDQAQSDTCDIDFADGPGESHWFAVIAQRRDGLYAHTLWIDRRSLWIAP